MTEVIVEVCYILFVINITYIIYITLKKKKLFFKWITRKLHKHNKFYKLRFKINTFLKLKNELNIIKIN